MVEAATSEHPGSGLFHRIASWFDTRFGLSYPLLRPVPRFAFNPAFWLGALTVVAFVILAVTGVLMMLYYVPTPDRAYSSTQYIFTNVYYGRFIETVHLYTAYAMVLLMFAHLMRGFFVSVHKRPREAMWLLGMLMGGVTLGLAFTGYLLPWTVVSKSATDVAIGMLAALPPPISSAVAFLIAGTGGDAAELLRFYDLHVVVLPAILLAMLAVKMYMLEAHGIAEPATKKPLTPKQAKTAPIFPDVTLYLLEIAAVFGAGMLLISALFPVDLPPMYTPAAAGNYTAQPDWYFLWLYQILKVSAFEGSGLPVALALVGAVFVVLFLLPFLDRKPVRAIQDRRVFVTLGSIFVAELSVLTVWGLFTPGQVIDSTVGAAVLGGTALGVAAVVYAAYRGLAMRRGRMST